MLQIISLGPILVLLLERENRQSMLVWPRAQFQQWHHAGRLDYPFMSTLLPVVDLGTANAS